MTRPATPNWPAALPLNLAAAYCGLSVDTFKTVCPVKPVSFTQSTRGHRYLRTREDEDYLRGYYNLMNFGGTPHKEHERA